MQHLLRELGGLAQVEHPEMGQRRGSGLRHDFDIWRNIVREFSEELLGMLEYDGTPKRADRLRRLASVPQPEPGWAEGKVSAVCLGAGLDALRAQCDPAA